MLVISRRESEGLWIDGNIYIKVLDVNRGRAKLGIEAPKEVPIIREELATDPGHRTEATPPNTSTCYGNEQPAMQDARVALERARIALEEAAPFLPLDSTADRAASRAVASIHHVLRTGQSQAQA